MYRKSIPITESSLERESENHEPKCFPKEIPDQAKVLTDQIHGWHFQISGQQKDEWRMLQKPENYYFNSLIVGSNIIEVTVLSSTQVTGNTKRCWIFIHSSHTEETKKFAFPWQWHLHFHLSRAHLTTYCQGLWQHIHLLILHPLYMVVLYICWPPLPTTLPPQTLVWSKLRGKEIKTTYDSRRARKT